jgi:hypothetical protein
MEVGQRACGPFDKLLGEDGHIIVELGGIQESLPCGCGTEN